MSDVADARIDWPHFTLLTYSAPTGIPHGWDAELLAKGAPEGLVCTAARELVLMEHPDAGPLVCFATAGPDEYLCLVPHTKRVVLVVYGAFRTGDPQPEFVGPAWVVNSSLDQLIASVRAVTERFPFESDLAVEERAGAAHEDEQAREERGFNERARAVEELAETLDHIDPAAFADPGEFWHMFVADVGMGNYATANVLREPEQ
jgi:hypothetical protein